MVCVGGAHVLKFIHDYRIIVEESFLLNSDVPMDFFQVEWGGEKFSLQGDYSIVSKLWETFMRVILCRHGIYLFHVGGVVSRGVPLLFWPGEVESKTVAVLEELMLPESCLLGDDRLWINVKERVVYPFPRYITLNRPKAYFLLEGITMYAVVFRIAELLKPVDSRLYRFFAHRPRKLRVDAANFCNKSGLALPAATTEEKISDEKRKSAREFNSDLLESKMHLTPNLVNLLHELEEH